MGRAVSPTSSSTGHAAAQQRMARLTGKDTRGNERLARQHPRNVR